MFLPSGSVSGAKQDGEQGEQHAEPDGDIQWLRITTHDDHGFGHGFDLHRQ